MRYLIPILLVACESAAPEPGLSHPLSTVCQKCDSDVDCADGLACDHLTFACKTPAQFVAQYVDGLTKGQPQCSADCAYPCGVKVHCSINPGPAYTNFAPTCLPDNVTCSGDCRY